jgi:membrane protease subunit HflK
MNYDNPFSRVNPPDMDKVKKAGRRFGPALIGIIVILYLAVNSIYTLNDGEEAVITRFGKYVETEKTSGLKFKLPFADTAHKVNVMEIRSMEFGWRNNSDILEEAIMLTQEENLVKADWVIQWQVSNSYNYKFKVDNVEATLHAVTQAAYRRVVAAHPLDDILTDNKADIMREVERDLQEICNKYEMGVKIVRVQLQDAQPPNEAVREAFLDVTRALEKKEERILDAERYKNENLPIARGEAAAMVNDAEAYKERRINEAAGAVARYIAIQAEYQNQPDVMRTRLYLEMIREVLPKVEKVYFLDQSSGSLLEILHLGQ